MPHPYSSLPAEAFWRTAVAEPGLPGLRGLWCARWPLRPSDPVATLGSCFAQRIGRALRGQGWHWVDAEPAPRGLDEAQAEAHGYGLFSARVGNVYTAAQLRQWVEWALDERATPPTLWRRDDRVYDPFRPGIEPAGFASEREALVLRNATQKALARALRDAHWLVFTLGLVEGWQDLRDGVVLPLAPGVVAGSFDPERHVWRQWRHAEIAGDLLATLELLKRHNPALRLLLSVSPVPLTATCSGQHVLVASTAAKATLRAVAAELADTHPDIDYFPAYEVIASHPARARFFDTNLRTVTAEGVENVMRHFFAGLGDVPPTPACAASTLAPATAPDTAGAEAQCDEALLDAFRPKTR